MVSTVAPVLTPPPCPDNVKISTNGSVISITGAHAGNQGAYHCVASNRFGVASSVVNLLVQGARLPGCPHPCPCVLPMLQVLLGGICILISILLSPEWLWCPHPHADVPVSMLMSSICCRCPWGGGVPIPVSSLWARCRRVVVTPSLSPCQCSPDVPGVVLSLMSSSSFRCSWGGDVHVPV